MKTQNRPLQKGKTLSQSRQTKNSTRPDEYIAALTARKAWLPTLRRLRPRICATAALLECRNISSVVYTAIVCWLHLAETRLGMVKKYPGEVDPHQYSCMIGENFAGFDFSELEARFDALAARIEAPVDVVLFKTISEFLDFAKVNHVLASDAIYTVAEQLRLTEAAKVNCATADKSGERYSSLPIPREFAQKIEICARWCDVSFREFCRDAIKVAVESDAGDIEAVAKGRDILLPLTNAKKRQTKSLYIELQALEAKRRA